MTVAQLGTSLMGLLLAGFTADDLRRGEMSYPAVSRRENLNLFWFAVGCRAVVVAVTVGATFLI